MRKSIWLGLLLGVGAALFPAAVRAQAPASAMASAAARPNYLRLGLGTTYDGYGYYRCARVGLEYAPLLSRKIGLASRVVGVAGKPREGLEAQLPDQNYRAAYLEQEVVFYPFGSDKRVNFGVGGGGFAGY